MQAGSKIVPLEVKSSGGRTHESIDVFCGKYSRHIGDMFLLSQKDVGHQEQLQFKPIYMLPFILEEL